MGTKSGDLALHGSLTETLSPLKTDINYRFTTINKLSKKEINSVNYYRNMSLETKNLKKIYSDRYYNYNANFYFLTFILTKCSSKALANFCAISG